MNLAVTRFIYQHLLIKQKVLSTILLSFSINRLNFYLPSF